MELGSYTSDAVQSASGDSQQLLADYYIGIRGAWLKESASLLENSEPLWANLTAGAVSTAGRDTKDALPHQSRRPRRTVHL